MQPLAYYLGFDTGRLMNVLFLDAGGIILDESKHERVRAEIIVEILRRLDNTYTLSDYYSDVDEAVRMFCPGVYQYVVWKRVGHDRGFYDRVYEEHLIRWRREKPPLTLMAGIESTLRELADDFRIGIAGQYGREIIELLDRESLSQFFEWHFTQDDFTMTKPDTRFYVQLVERCGVKPDESIMVGDRIDKDIAPAKMIGMKTILVRTGLHVNQQPRLPSEIPDREIDNVTGLTDAVMSLSQRMLT
jgi:HAD superfamily hydrolase (TIGR01549 family)